jgi:hypothetical protein
MSDDNMQKIPQFVEGWLPNIITQAEKTLLTDSFIH